MARHRQPRELAELKGATKKDPQRYKKEAPKTGKALGKVPSHLPVEVAEVWKELEKCALPGVLTSADRFIMEVASSLLSEFRVKPGEFVAAKYTHLIGCLARLGLTPADRQKLGTEKTPEGNQFDEF